ncbi:MAG: biotin/lipoyl-binding protein [Bacteroidia bacterium]|nr:biotin/lipoyl-binding protein [Bacteroidia bacterium]
MSIQRLLIANRGEIARRIIRTCRKMGIASIAIYSDADRHYPFVREADEAYALGGNTATDTYLNAQKIIELADRAEADAIHPGYGFLSENAAFARAVSSHSQERLQAGKKPLLFIGPHPDAIEQMGSKSNAKILMQKVGIPTVPGFQKRGASVEEMREEAERLGFPVLLKAAGGGGGKGMRIVYEPDAFIEAFESAQREALHAFGDQELLLEKYFPSARHIEFQILGDKHGRIVHLFERECSIQRRYQKILEETPAPMLTPADREAMGAAAVRAAQTLRYDSAGTVEFIHVREGEFYFLEVNTRLQVEHPITEVSTGIDLVEWQIRIAQGESLPFSQESLEQRGHAIEVRLYAEDPARDFAPSTGKILYWDVPDVPYLRVDSGIETGSLVSPYYDPLLAKLIVHAETRREALRRLEYVLSRTVCLGLPHNLGLLRALCQDEDFIKGEYDTQFLPRKPHLRLSPPLATPALIAYAVGLTLWRILQAVKRRAPLPDFPPNWRNTLQTPLPHGWRIQDNLLTVTCIPKSTELFLCKGTDWEGIAHVLQIEENLLRYEWKGQLLSLFFYRSSGEEEKYWVYHPGMGGLEVKLLPRFPVIEQAEKKGSYKATMPGQVTQILVQPGEQVSAGQTLLVFVSMKMENRIQAAEAGTVQAVYVREGDTIEAGTQLLHIEPLSEK